MFYFGCAKMKIEALILLYLLLFRFNYRRTSPSGRANLTMSAVQRAYRRTLSTPPRPLLAATAILTRKYINLSCPEGCTPLYFQSI